MSGDGDGCRSENTYSEWYMIPNPDPTIFCLGDGRYFEWSTGWTVVDHFKWYFTYNNSYAQNLGWTSSYSTAAIMLAPGDVIQLQILGSDGTWIGSHSVLLPRRIVQVYMLHHIQMTTWTKTIRYSTFIFKAFATY